MSEAKDSPTVAEAKAAKFTLERDIEHLLNAYSGKYGLRVDRVNVERLDGVTAFQGRVEQVAEVTVKVDVSA